MEKDCRLFDGEVAVKTDGIYTYVHYYEHPETKRKVVMVGMNHVGDEGYFEKVAGILDGCEVVLYEGTPPEQETLEETIDELEEDLAKMQKPDINEAFYAALRAYSERITEYSKLALEKNSFDYKKDGWESGDAEFFLRLKNDENLQMFSAKRLKNLCRLTLERKKAVIEYVNQSLKCMEDDQFTKKDFGDGLIFFYSDPELVELIIDELGKPRDELVFECFDKIIQRRNPRSIGIKFGAGHMPNQCRLLERRGYVLRYSIGLRNIAF